MTRRLLAVIAALTLLTAACTSGRTETATPTPTAPATATAEPTLPIEVDPNLVVLQWTRAGGIGGFCDGLAMTAGHRAALGTCEVAPDLVTDGEIAPTDLIIELEDWRSAYASFEVIWDDGPDVADGMRVALTFVGRGAETADERTQRAIEEFAARLFTELSSRQLRASLAPLPPS